MLRHAYFLGFEKTHLIQLINFPSSKIGPGPIFSLSWTPGHCTMREFKYNINQFWLVREIELIFTLLTLKNPWRRKMKMKVVVCFIQGVPEYVFNSISRRTNCINFWTPWGWKPLLTSLNVCIYKLMLMFDAWMALIPRRERILG